MSNRQEMARQLLVLVEQLIEVAPNSLAEASCVTQLEQHLHAYRQALAKARPRQAQANLVEVGVPAYHRTVALQSVTWWCMACGTQYEEQRPPGTFLPRYCQQCSSQLRLFRDRVRARRRAIEAYNFQEEEQAKQEARLPVYKEFRYNSPEEERWAERPAQYCHNCGYDFGEKSAGTATVILRKVCPECNETEAETEQQYVQSVREVAKGKQQWRMPHLTGRSVAQKKRPGRKATLGSSTIDKER